MAHTPKTVLAFDAKDENKPSAENFSYRHLQKQNNSELQNRTKKQTLSHITKTTKNMSLTMNLSLSKHKQTTEKRKSHQPGLTQTTTQNIFIHRLPISSNTNRKHNPNFIHPSDKNQLTIASQSSQTASQTAVSPLQPP